MSLLQEAVNELGRLYRLRNEGKKVQTLIDRIEELIQKYCEFCEEEQMVAEETDEANN